MNNKKLTPLKYVRLKKRKHKKLTPLNTASVKRENVALFLKRTENVATVSQETANANDIALSILKETANATYIALSILEETANATDIALSILEL